MDWHDLGVFMMFLLPNTVKTCRRGKLETNEVHGTQQLRRARWAFLSPPPPSSSYVFLAVDLSALLGSCCDTHTHTISLLLLCNCTAAPPPPLNICRSCSSHISHFTFINCNSISCHPIEYDSTYLPNWLFYLGMLFQPRPKWQIRHGHTIFLKKESM